MTILRRALQAFAAIWAGCGAALLLAPRPILETWFGQPRYPDYAYVRVVGALSITLAMLAVMVARRDDAWWWAWAFAIATALCATIAVLHVLFELPDGAGAALWWLFAGTGAALTGWLVVGLTRASQEHPVA
jgi:hypothetical protein